MARPDRALHVVLATAFASMLLTAVFVSSPQLALAYHAPGLRVALETVTSLTSLLAALLVYGRFSRDRELSDALLATGLAVLSVSNLLYSALPTALNVGQLSSFSVWAAVGGRLAGAITVAAAAFAPPRRLEDRGPVLGSILAMLLLAAIVAAGLAGVASPGITVSDVAGDAHSPRLVGHPVLIGAQALGGIAFALAAIGFARRAQVTGDALALWLGAAAVFAAASRLNYVLYPSRFTPWVYLGDVFRLAFDLTVAGAAVGEIRSYWHRLSTAAVHDERRRLARDIHDGVAQELALIGRRVPGVADPQLRSVLEEAVGRALAESRRAIEALAMEEDDDLAAALHRLGTGLRERLGVIVEVRCPHGMLLDGALIEAFTRIAAEATTNAVYHGKADVVEFRARRVGGSVRLRVSDDGSGFDTAMPASAPDRGFGLRSMRERATAAGGVVDIRSTVGAGTVVEVTI